MVWLKLDGATPERLLQRSEKTTVELMLAVATPAAPEVQVFPEHPFANVSPSLPETVHEVVTVEQTAPPGDVVTV